MWPHHKTIEVSKNVPMDWACSYSKDDYYQWAVALKEDSGEPIGSIAVVHKNDDIEMAHIGYGEMRLKI